MADRLMRADPAADDVPPAKIDTTVAHIARVYDYWLGGKDHFAVDRAAVGEQHARGGPGGRPDGTGGVRRQRPDRAGPRAPC